MEDCREEEKLINEMGIALDRLRQDVQADVERANPQYQNALNALKLLSKTDYDEIRTFRQPPQPVLAVMINNLHNVPLFFFSIRRKKYA